MTSPADACLLGPEIPNPDYQSLGEPERRAVLTALEGVPCSCGCTMPLVTCALVDPVCPSGRRLISAGSWFAIKGWRGPGLLAATLAFERRVPAHAFGPSELGAEARVSVAGRPRIGPAGAVATVVVFADWRNPEATSLSVTVSALTRRFAERLAFVFKSFPSELPIGTPSESEALLEAEAQGRTEPFFRALAQRPRPWDPASIASAAAEAGLDSQRLDAALASGRWRTVVREDHAEAMSAGVGQAPALVVGGRLYRGGQGPVELAPVVEAVLAELDAAAPASVPEGEAASARGGNVAGPGIFAARGEGVTP